MERISKELIKKGIENGVITFGVEDNLLAAHIGDYWFFMCSEYDKTEKDFTKKQLVRQIHEVINDEPINDEDEEFATECLYYKAILSENLKTAS